MTLVITHSPLQFCGTISVPSVLLRQFVGLYVVANRKI